MDTPGFRGGLHGSAGCFFSGTSTWFPPQVPEREEHKCRVVRDDGTLTLTVRTTEVLLSELVRPNCEILLLTLLVPAPCHSTVCLTRLSQSESVSMAHSILQGCAHCTPRCIEGRARRPHRSPHLCPRGLLHLPSAETEPHRPKCPQPTVRTQQRNINTRSTS